FGLLLAKQLLLIARLYDVDHHQHPDHEVERGLGHGRDLVAEQVQVGQVASLREQHDPDDEQDEQTQHLEHPVLLKEVGHLVGHEHHQKPTNDDGGGHDPEHTGERHRAQDRVEREHEGHDHDHRDDRPDRLGFLLSLGVGTVFFDAHHVPDFFDRSVEDEHSTYQHNDRVQVELPRNPAGVDPEEHVLHG